mmetsp:Transcript_17619/g.49133  ORF Transcript_17619/g.49133 Transcript_17619/m.49133 type:complete len:116 (+) Transcript_17619:2354-2701(+)
MPLCSQPAFMHGVDGPVLPLPPHSWGGFLGASSRGRARDSLMCMILGRGWSKERPLFETCMISPAHAAQMHHSLAALPASTEMRHRPAALRASAERRTAGGTAAPSQQSHPGCTG